MKKNKSITFRCSEKTYLRIQSIRQQMIDKGFDEDMLTDAYIIRESIRALDEKIKYFIYDIELKK